MKLLLSCDEYCYCLNGQYYLHQFGNILTQRYLQVFDSLRLVIRTKTVTTKEELGSYTIPINPQKIELIPVPFFQGPKEFIKYFFKIRSSLRHCCNNCDIAILRLPSTCAFVILHKLKKYHIPYATEIVFDCKDGFNTTNGLLNKLIWYILHQMQKKACSKAIGVACVTKTYLQQRYYSKLPQALTANYSSIEMPESFLYKARPYPKDNQFRIVHVANQVYYGSRKGHNELIEALKIVRDNGFNASVIFVGGDYFNGIKQLKLFAKEKGIDNFVNFTGMLSQNELRNIMINSNLAVLPTKAEGLPRVIIEAMALGLPCISTNVSGIPELLDKEYLFNYTDINGIANGIIKIISNPILYESISQTNFERSKQYESTYLNIKRTDFYSKLKTKIQLTKATEH